MLDLVSFYFFIMKGGNLMARFKPMLLLSVLITALLSITACGDNNGEVAASVNGEKIYQEDLDKKVEQSLSMFGMTLESEESAEMIEMLEPSILDRMILETLILQEGEDNKIKASKEEVDNEFETIKASVPEEMIFEEVLEDQNFTEKSLRQEIENQIILSKVLTLEHLKEAIEVTDEEIESYYNQLVEEYGEEINDLESEKEEITFVIQQEKYLENLQANADIEMTEKEA